jgi:hypothetical protein
MSQLTKSDFDAKFTANTGAALFKDNTSGDITAEDVRTFADDIADTFLSISDNFIDEDSFVSDSATKVPSQQSVKAYIAAQIAGGSGAVSGSLTSGRVPVASGTNSLQDYNTLKFDGTKLSIGNVTPDSLLHVWESSAGSVTAPANTLATFERNGAAYITILTPDASERGIYFGEASDNDIGGILYNTSGTQDGFELRANGATRAWITSAGNLGLGASPTYNLDVIVSSGTAVSRITNTGSGEVSHVVSRSGGTAAEWQWYIPSGSANFLLYNGSNRIGVTSAGVFQILTTPSTDNTATPLAIDGSGNVVKRSDASGTYTPTITAGPNVSSTSAFTLQYSRTGNTITVAGWIGVTATASATHTEIEFTLPFNPPLNSFSSNAKGGGVGTSLESPGLSSTIQEVAFISAAVTTPRARFIYKSQTTAARAFSITFTYNID